MELTTTDRKQAREGDHHQTPHTKTSTVQAPITRSMSVFLTAKLVGPLHGRASAAARAHMRANGRAGWRLHRRPSESWVRLSGHGIGVPLPKITRKFDKLVLIPGRGWEGGEEARGGEGGGKNGVAHRHAPQWPGKRVGRRHEGAVPEQLQMIPSRRTWTRWVHLDAQTRPSTATRPHSPAN